MGMAAPHIVIGVNGRPGSTVPSKVRLNQHPTIFSECYQVGNNFIPTDAREIYHLTSGLILMPGSVKQSR